MAEEKQTGALAGSDYKAEAVLAEAEPWEGWETRLVLYSIGVGIAVLIVGGILISTFLLP